MPGPRLRTSVRDFRGVRNEEDFHLQSCRPGGARGGVRGGARAVACAGQRPQRPAGGRGGVRRLPRQRCQRRAQDRRRKRLERPRRAGPDQPHPARYPGHPEDAGARRQRGRERFRAGGRDHLHGQPVGRPLGHADRQVGSHGRPRRRADRASAVRQVPRDRHRRRAQDRRPLGMDPAPEARTRRPGSLRDRGHGGMPARGGWPISPTRNCAAPSST